MNSGIGVGSLLGKRTNILGLNNEKTMNLDNNPTTSINNLSSNLDSKFNPSQNAHLMSNLINLNLQLNRMVYFF
jgi:hypothetical protein